MSSEAPAPLPPSTIVEDRDFRQALTCPVCLDFYKQPRHLSSCPHSFCGECIANLWTASPDHHDEPDAVNCPVCRQPSWIDEAKGLNGFHVNVELKRLVELFIERSHDKNLAKRQRLDEIVYNNRDPQRQAEFFESCTLGDLDKLQAMLAQPRSDVLIEARYHRPKHGLVAGNSWYSNNTCLHIAAWGSHRQVIKAILGTYLDQKKDVPDRGVVLSRLINEQGISSGWTALHCAAHRGSAECVMELCCDERLRGIIDLELRTQDGFKHPGFSALMLAVYSKHPKTVEELVKQGVQVNARHVKSGKTALGFAKEQGFDDIAEMLAKFGGIE